LEHGKKLLRATDQSIQEISEACGYAEQANFTAAFRKKYGVAPGVWRKGGK
jgi:AraC-like DNA-binding protein